MKLIIYYSSETRSTPTLARGGSQQNFESQVDLLRRSSDGTNKFSRVVKPGTIVQIGEELLLRASVREGDGMFVVVQIILNISFWLQCFKINI